MAVGAAPASIASGRSAELSIPVDRQKTVRMERRGKSSPDGWRQSAAVNSIRSNTVGKQQVCPTASGRWLERVGDGASR